MKLFRHGASGYEKPGVLSADGGHLDASAFGEDDDEDEDEDVLVCGIEGLGQASPRVVADV